MKKYLTPIIILVLFGAIVLLAAHYSNNKTEENPDSTFSVSSQEDPLIRVDNYSAAVSEIVNEFAPQWAIASSESKIGIAQQILDRMGNLVIDGDYQQEHLENVMMISNAQAQLRDGELSLADDLLNQFFTSYIAE